MSEVASERDTPGNAVEVRDAALRFSERTLWSGLDFDVAPGEFVAVLGPNGSGKTSLLRVLLGLWSLSAGSVRIAGLPPDHGNNRVGYVPQQRAMDQGLTLRGRDLVGLGFDGHRWGFGLRGAAHRRRRVAEAIEAVGAEHYANAQIGTLSGGEQQRLRVAQALIGDPAVLLCDEPLASLDPAQQRVVAELIHERRRAADTAVMFVTHELNPILPYVDKVLYLVDGRFRIGTPDEVMTSSTLSQLYRSRVEVLRIGGQIHVAGTQNGLSENEVPHS